jgi:PAS domain S-box-containing protein
MNSEEFDFTNPRRIRKRAEEVLKEKHKSGEQATHESDVKKLLHELQVHQIELEMQNDELRQAYEAAEEALKKYTMLYDFAPMGYMSIDDNGTIHDLNFTAADMIGVRRARLIDANVRVFIDEESKSVFNAFLKKVFARVKKQTCVVYLRDGNNHSIRVYMEGVLIKGETKCILSLFDTSGLTRLS